MASLEAALIEYRNLLKKGASTVADHAILKEARQIGLQLRSEEQVTILSKLKESIDKNDLKTAEENVEALKVYNSFVREIFFLICILHSSVSMAQRMEYKREMIIVVIIVCGHYD